MQLALHADRGAHQRDRRLQVAVVIERARQGLERERDVAVLFPVQLVLQSQGAAQILSASA